MATGKKIVPGKVPLSSGPRGFPTANTLESPQLNGVDYYDFRSSMLRARGGGVMPSKRLGRTQDPTVLVLTSLTGGSKHGYSLIKDIEQMSGVSYGPGTLYGVLARLEQEGLVEPLPSEDRRRPYRITATGARVLRERLETTAKVASIGLRRLGAMGA